jgi:MFS superfamily sulfate permease-like transporter
VARLSSAKAATAVRIRSIPLKTFNKTLKVFLILNILRMRKLAILSIICSLFIACTTYTIPVESFREQMMKETPETMKQVKIDNPLFYRNIKYNSNNIKRIIVTEKDGKRTYLDNSPSIEMRVTHVNGKKYHFYFDTVILENDTLKGSRARLAKGFDREIPLDSIVTIEVQDGGKNYKYK